MADIFNLSWSRTSFFSKLLLLGKSVWRERGRVNSFDARIKADGYSALSSTYYSIVGTAGAYFGILAKSRPSVPIAGHALVLARLCAALATWLPLGAWCWWRMLYLSNRVVELIGYERMSAAQCDIRQSILRLRKRPDEARVCINHGLSKRDAELHTLGLLYAGLADVEMREGNAGSAADMIRSALAYAARAEAANARQAARIYRQCAGVSERLAESDFSAPKLRAKAESLARATGASDQLLKLNE